MDIAWRVGLVWCTLWWILSARSMWRVMPSLIKDYNKDHPFEEPFIVTIGVTLACSLYVVVGPFVEPWVSYQSWRRRRRIRRFMRNIKNTAKKLNAPDVMLALDKLEESIEQQLRDEQCGTS